MANDRFFGRTWFDREERTQPSLFEVQLFARFDRTYFPNAHVFTSKELEHIGKHLIPQLARHDRFRPTGRDDHFVSILTLKKNDAVTVATEGSASSARARNLTL